MSFQDTKGGCDIRQVCKRRDGGYRYWCMSHKADATAKYGVPANQCVAAFDDAVGPEHTLELNPADFPGGVALWGAVPAVYDTTSNSVDRGIHVHARREAGAEKVIDETVRRLRMVDNSSLLPDRWLEINELDAINYMVSSVFKKDMKFVACTLCGFPHLDRDWFSVHKHKRHLCHGCGRQFSDSEEGIGNPAFQLHSIIAGFNEPPLVKAKAMVSLRQADYPGGIRIWGSNPAIVWTGAGNEKEGIHIHAYERSGMQPVRDGTFGSVQIDGVNLAPEYVRVFMAQCAMPHIRERVVYLTCPACGLEHFDTDELAYTPHIHHECHSCGISFTSPTRSKLTIGNPFVETRRQMEQFAVNPLQPHFLNLRPESI